MQDKIYNFPNFKNDISKVKRPVFCCINISMRCIFKCKMCFHWKNKGTTALQEPALDEWFHFIELAADLTENSIEINISGGEPLLDDRNLALVKFSAKKGLPTSMPTNGFLIDKEMAYKIADSGLSAIGISLDGIKKDTHDFLRGVEGCYDKAIQAIDYLDKCCDNLKIGIQTIIFDRNLDEIIELAEWANNDKRISSISFQAIVQPFNTSFDKEWYNKSEYNFLWPQNTKKIYALLNELIKLKKMAYKIANPISQLEAFKRYFKNPCEFIQTNRCGVDSWLNINQSGDVYMCVYKGSIGNMKTVCPEELWYSEAANRIREEIKNCKVNCQCLVNCCYFDES